jgi:hypothetical protein
MKTAVLLIINVSLVGVFLLIMRKPGALTYYSNGRFWVTWLGIGVSPSRTS